MTRQQALEADKQYRDLEDVWLEKVKSIAQSRRLDSYTAEQIAKREYPKLNQSTQAAYERAEAIRILAKADDDQERLSPRDRKRKKRDSSDPGDSDTDRRDDRDNSSNDNTDPDDGQNNHEWSGDDSTTEIDPVNERYNDDSPGDGSGTDDGPDTEDDDDKENLNPRKKKDKAMQRVTRADGDAALQKLDRLAKELQQRSNMSYAQAYSEVLKLNASLYVVYLRSKQG